MQNFQALYMGNISDKENTYSFGDHYLKGQCHRLGPTWLDQYFSKLLEFLSQSTDSQVIYLFCDGIFYTIANMSVYKKMAGETFFFLHFPTFLLLVFPEGSYMYFSPTVSWKVKCKAVFFVFCFSNNFWSYMYLQKIPHELRKIGAY